MVNCQNGNLEKIIASGFFISLYYELQDISGLECFIINYANWRKFSLHILKFGFKGNEGVVFPSCPLKSFIHIYFLFWFHLLLWSWNTLTNSYSGSMSFFPSRVAIYDSSQYWNLNITSIYCQTSREANIPKLHLLVWAVLLYVLLSLVNRGTALGL